MGSLTLPTIAGIIAAIAAIGSPFIYFGTLERANAVQDVKITAIEKTNQEIRDNVEYIRRAIEQISIKQGIQGTTGAQGVQGVRGTAGVKGNDGVDAPIL